MAAKLDRKCGRVAALAILAAAQSPDFQQPLGFPARFISRQLPSRQNACRRIPGLYGRHIPAPVLGYLPYAAHTKCLVSARRNPLSGIQHTVTLPPYLLGGTYSPLHDVNRRRRKTRDGQTSYHTCPYRQNRPRPGNRAWHALDPIWPCLQRATCSTRPAPRAPRPACSSSAVRTSPAA